MFSALIIVMWKDSSKLWYTAAEEFNKIVKNMASLL